MRHSVKFNKIFTFLVYRSSYYSKRILISFIFLFKAKQFFLDNIPTQIMSLLARIRCSTCGEKYDSSIPNNFFISCNECECFYHGKCVGISKSEAKILKNRSESYECGKCKKKKKSKQPKCKICGGADSSLNFLVQCAACRCYLHDKCVKLNKNHENVVVCADRSYNCQACAHTKAAFKVRKWKIVIEKRFYT